nr:MAG TPA: hypothetical protein [Caudoviricetes sp.]
MCGLDIVHFVLNICLLLMFYLIPIYYETVF